MIADEKYSYDDGAISNATAKIMLASTMRAPTLPCAKYRPRGALAVKNLSIQT
jgi:hypothetical protein